MSRKKDDCSFGTKCYRLNPIHFREFSHSHLDTVILELGLDDQEDDYELPEDFKAEVSNNTIKQQIGVILSMKKHSKISSNYQASKEGGSLPTGAAKPSSSKDDLSVADKWKRAAPYHFFMTNVSRIPDTVKENLSIGLSDLYDKSLGDIKESLQINFMVDVNFLMKSLAGTQCSKKPMLILYETSNIEDLKSYKDHQITAVSVKPKSMFGHHHTKMSLFLYNDQSIRVVVSTANLIEDDWNDYSQGVWISPSCAPCEDVSKGESPSAFRSSLAAYLNAYKLKELENWVKLVKGADFSQVKVCFIASIPSTGPTEVRHWGLGRLKFLLLKHVPGDAAEAEWPALIQCSSIGSLGTTPSEWVENQMKAAMLGLTRNPISKTPLRLIYPCLKDVKGSLSGGGCLPYAYETHRKQLWINEFVHKWQSSNRKRTLAMPHIKTYCRVSPDWKKAAWFLLTSANLSKAAWGRSTHQGSGQNIMSYEAGVLFCPHLMIGKKHFKISHSSTQENDDFPFPYDLPPTKYEQSDKMWLADYMMS